jgi:hypothetical protein
VGLATSLTILGKIDKIAFNIDDWCGGIHTGARGTGLPVRALAPAAPPRSPEFNPAKRWFEELRAALAAGSATPSPISKPLWLRLCTDPETVLRQGQGSRRIPG